MKKLILLLVLTLCMALAVVFWASTLVPGLPWAAYVHEVGKLLALVGFVLIVFQYVLSSKIKWIERGIGLDRLFGIHKKFGLLALPCILAHPILIAVSEKLQGYESPMSGLKVLGITTLLMLFVAVGVAILYDRFSLKYETWKNIHKVSYAVFALGFLHSIFLGSDLQRWPFRVLWLILALIFVAILVYKIWQRLYLRSHPFQVAEVIKETHDTWTIYFEGIHLDYKPGQFMIIQLVRDGTVSESHPFTIASSPTRERLSISVKSVGDFTATISDTTTSDLAYIDMPYGVFSFLNYVAQDLVLIAGGIGITPFMSMLRYLYDKRLEKNVILLWGNKTEKDIAFRKELETIASEMPSVTVVHVLSHQEDWPGERGHIDADKLKKYVGTFLSRQFLICGPPSMMIAVERTLRELGVPKNKIHYERFALR
jgi:predicted ferric reductase